MPGDPAILEGVPATLTNVDLLNDVAIKLPPFWPDNIKMWFVQTESEFRLKGVSASQTKFDYVVQSMCQTDAVKVLDLIRAPPAADPYGYLKDFFFWDVRGLPS